MENLGLYIHIPFCRRKCHYCDFVSYPAMDEFFDEYIAALAAELLLYRDDLQDYTVDTLFIGGGTPSLLSPDQIAALIRGIRDNCRFAPVEITIEANPESMTEDKAKSYAELGVNRLSIGMQTHDDGILQKIGRCHTYDMFIAAYEAAKRHIKNINIDTMFALPGQTVVLFQETLSRLIALAPSHISSYALKLESGTPLERTFSGVDENIDRAMYHLAADMLTEAGYHHYETSNFSLPGTECLHNMKYWTGGAYLGLGVASHSYMTEGGKRRYSNIESVSEYLLSVADGQKPIAEYSRLLPSEEKEEYIMLRLRLSLGIDVAEYNAHFNADFLSEFAEAISRTERAGLIVTDGTHIVPTLKGFDLQNTLITEFMKNL